MLGILIVLGIALGQLPDYYHQSSNIDLSQFHDCASITSLSDYPDIKLISINPDKHQKAFILFGEHARELIGPETGLRFLESVCSQEQSVNFQMKMILNLNPISREKVEKGDYCLRLNENGVDLNRNYDIHFESYVDNDRQTTSGSEAFSELQTRLVRDTLSEYQPDVFLSIHSGVLGLYTPYSYSVEQPPNVQVLEDLLKPVQEEHCPICDLGQAAKNAGYLATGSCLDYAFESAKIPYSFLFEIYHPHIKLADEIKLHKLKQQKQGVESQQQQQKSSFIQMKDDMTADECFEFFNPGTQADYEWYTKNWSDAIGVLLDGVDKHMNEQILSHN